MKNFQICFRKIVVILQITMAAFVLSSAARAAGEVDSSFNPSLLLERIGTTRVERLLVQPDGKILVGGAFSVIGKTRSEGVARLNADGTVDQTFRAQVSVSFAFSSYGVYALAAQTDGKTLVGGFFTTVSGQARPGLARLNSDGSLDATFNPQIAGGIPNRLPAVFDVKTTADGKILISGDFSYNSFANRNVARLNADGSIDSTFAAPAVAASYDYGAIIEPLANGKLLVAFSGSPSSGVYRLNADGSIDSSFMTIAIGGGVKTLKTLADGRFYIGGDFSSYNGFPLTTRNLVRFNADGSLDTSFNAGNVGPNSGVTRIEILPNNQLLVGGYFTTFNGVNRRTFARINSDGSLDNSFTLTGNVVARDFALAADGSIYVGTMAGSGGASALIKINADGSIPAAQLLLGEGGTANRVVVQPDGKILIVGNFTHTDNQARGNVSRVNPDGTLDTMFAFVGAGSVYYSADVRADGKILLSSTGGVVRVSANGAVDFSINSGATLDAKFLPGGGAVITSNGSLRRITETGAYDSSLNVMASATIRRVAVQPDGKIIAVGDFTSIGGNTRGRIARFNADGTIDATFNPIGTNNSIFDVALQPDGKIVIGGTFTGVNLNTNYKYAARLNADGSLDTTFNPIIEGGVLSVKVQTSGKIIIGGGIYSVNGAPRGNIARLNADGTLDAGFTASTDNLVWSIDTQANGNIIIGGTFTRVNNLDRLGVARLLDLATTTRAPFDFDGDGKADVSVFRPSGGFWYLLNSTNGFSAAQFGASTDQIVPADYDNDGKTDLAVFRSGTWYIQRSTLGFTGVQFGESTDIPVPADYDADGKADIAVFRPSNGIWYIQRSTLGFLGVQFGAPEDRPTLGDFDGDGKADIAVFRPSNGVWYRLNSSTGALAAMQFGDAADKVVPADYDADGKTDIAVFRPSNGVWYLQRSTLGFNAIQFGAAEDRPVPADYDGDGKADVAVFRPSAGAWYLNRSQAGFTGVGFGAPDDKPAPNAYVR